MSAEATAAGGAAAGASSRAAKLQRWTTARDSLTQQVAVLERQTSAHKEQLRDLERRQPPPPEAGEEITQMKRKCAAVHRAKLDAQRRLNLANVEIGRLQMPADKKDYSTQQQHIRQQQQACQQYYAQRNQQQQQHQQLPISLHTIQRSNGASPVANVDEVEKLRQTIEKLVSDNQQKNMEITSLRQALGQRPPQLAARSYSVGGTAIGGRAAGPALDINAQLRRLLIDDELLANEATAGAQMAHSSSYPTSLCAGGAPSPFQHGATALLPGYPTAAAQWPNFGPHSPLYYDAAGHYYEPLPPMPPAVPSMMTESYSAPISGLASFAAGRAGASSPAMARQLAAELDELRQRYSPSIHCASLPRTAHAKSNSVSAGLSLPRARTAQRPSDAHKPSHGRDGRASSSSDASSGQLGGFSRSMNAGLPRVRREVSPPVVPPRSASAVTRFASVGAMKKARASSRSIRALLFPGRRPEAVGDVSMAPHCQISAAGRSTSVPNLSAKRRHLRSDYCECGTDSEENDCNRMVLRQFGELVSDDEMTSGRRPLTTGMPATRHRAGAEPPEELKRGRARSTLRNFFGRLARSSSQDLRHSPAAAAAITASRDDVRQRSSIRTSASARFADFVVECAASTATAASGEISPPLRPAVQQFVDWAPAEVCAWLRVADLEQYAPAAARFVRSGRHLLNLTGAELQKELQMKSGLHRRRLKCLLNCIERNTGDLVEPADRMNVNQVILWLDSIGVPQYRDNFAAHRIDGQMLVCLTVADLVEMRIVSAMNHATFARAIQLLRAIDFRTHLLERRFAGGTEVHPSEVERWTAACVADWLRGIDLAEFTPNLMFAGVHGSLMVNEPTFTSESLAEVLQIPPHRTLLRRHLTTHFNSLLGAEIIGQKRDALAQPFVAHLSPTLRIKLVKKGILGARKKSKNDIFVEPHVTVCPTTRLAAGPSAATLDDPAEDTVEESGDCNLKPNMVDCNTTTDI